MRFIPTVAHGVADYLVGVMVMALPFVFGWTGSDRIFFLALGFAVICYSLLTDYELGLVRVLRIRFHLLLDGLFGLAMLAAPSFLHISGGNGTIVYVIGALALVLTFTTKIRAQGTGSEAVVEVDT
jgi:hypothetical protein